MALFFQINQSGYSQNLPDAFHFSPNRLRLIREGSESTGFYHAETIDTLYLIFSQADYWTTLTNNYNSKTDLPATLIYKGVQYNEVGVRFKGETSYATVSGQKKSFNITLDYALDQDIEGYSTLNLNNAAEDPSYMKEFLYEYFNRKHIPAVRVNYCVLYINNMSWGIYVNVQQLNRQHAKEWFMDEDATRWRAEPLNRTTGGGSVVQNPGGRPGGGGGGGGGDFGASFGAGTSSFNYLNTTDTSVYKNYYTLKKAYKDKPWEDLVNACYILNNTPADVLVDTLGKYMDIDGVLWYLAHEILFTDEDSYVYKGGTDYYIYYDVGTNRIIPVEYDGNSTFMSNSALSWSPFYKETNSSYPLASVLFNIPELRQRYLAHVRTILGESFNQTCTDSIIDHYADFIDPWVSSDPKNMYSYSQFLNGITGLKSFISSRRDYLLSNIEVKTTGLTIDSVIFKSGNENFSVPDHTQDTKVSAAVTGNTGTGAVYLYYGTDLMGSFSKVQMYDDGNHNDNLQGDNAYGAIIPPYPKNTFVRFYIEAVASNSAGTRSYSPSGAEHDVYIYQVKTAGMVEDAIVINEIMASNSNTIADQDGEYDDWIELFNKSPETIALSGYYLTDNENNLTKWQIPEGTDIEGNGYLIIWTDNQVSQTGLHTNFKLSADGETVLLVTPGFDIADMVTYPYQPMEKSFSRIPNGTGSFTWQLATFNMDNNYGPTSVSNGNYLGDGMKMFPNPANEVFVISDINSEKTHELIIYNLYGSLFLRTIFTESTAIDVSGWPAGMYIVTLDMELTKKLSVVH